MSLDPRFIVGININDYFVDKTTGLPLSGGTISFFKDQNRSQAKLVYELTGSPPNYTYTPLSDPLTLSPVGTVVNSDIPAKNVAIYYYPYDDLGNIELYYIVVQDSNGTIQLEREAWPNLTSEVSPTGSSSSVVNQLQNSQFVDTTFNPEYGLTISIPSTVTGAIYEVAPNWFLNISTNGSATIIVNRTAISGSANIETNPPFQLEILPEGANITTLNLYQRLNNNPDIWANGYLAGSCVAASLDGIAHTIQMVYSPSVTSAATTIFDQPTLSTGYTQLSGTVQLLAGDNTDNGDVGYVDIIYILPTIGSVAITSTQVIGLSANITDVGYDQDTANNQKSMLFDYYNPYIQAVPVPSISEGWDFKLNPAQASNNGVVAPWSGASQYVWDQTIVWQSANGLASIYRDAVNRLWINTTATGQFALVQYLSAQQLHVLLANGWSTLINAYTSNVSGAAGTVSFYYTTDSSLPVLTGGTNQSLISTLDANGKPATFHGNWTELPNPLLGENRFTIPYSGTNTTSSVALNGWEQPLFGVSSTATYIAIVVGFASLPATNIYFDSISVTPGRLAVPFAPIGSTLTLKQMQRYYEKSYPINITPGTPNIDDGAYLVTCRAVGSTPITSTATALLTNIGIIYSEKVVSIPLTTLWSVITGNSNSYDVIWYSTGSYLTDGTFPTSGTFNTIKITSSSAVYIDNNALATASYTGPDPDTAIQYFHYTADSRYGLI